MFSLPSILYFLCNDETFNFIDTLKKNKDKFDSTNECEEEFSKVKAFL